MQKRFAFGYATRETFAEAQFLTALFHQRQLMFDIFDIAQDALVDGEGVQMVGAKEATAVADRADGQLVVRTVRCQPFREEHAFLRSYHRTIRIDGHIPCLRHPQLLPPALQA